MADQGEGRGRDMRRAAEPGKAPSAGREDKAARGGPERYPPVRQDDAVERTGFGEQVRSFEPADEAPPPRDVSGDTDGGQKGFEGPQADPAEGKP
jgi:hypothetical protein